MWCARRDPVGYDFAGLAHKEGTEVNTSLAQKTDPTITKQAPNNNVFPVSDSKFNTNLDDVFSILESEYFPEYNIISSEKAAFAKPLPN